MLRPEPSDWSFTTTPRFAGLPTVSALSLAELLQSLGESSISLLKIDLQGAEYDILRANYNLLAEACENLLVTYSHSRARSKELLEIERQLESRGFKPNNLGAGYRIYQSQSPK